MTCIGDLYILLYNWYVVSRHRIFTSLCATVTADASTEIAWVDFMLFMIVLAIRFSRTGAS